VSRVAIRRAVGSDAGSVALLLGALGLPTDSDVVAERLASSTPADHVLVAVAGSTVVGLVSLSTLPLLAEGGRLARVTALVVDQEHRRSGVGQMLVQAAEALAVDCGCRLIQVSSGKRPERQPAHRLYERLGYADASTHHTLFEKKLPARPPGEVPPSPAHASGMLPVGDGHELYWEVRGNPDGKPAVVLHGGPGSGCTPGYSRFFDTNAYRLVLFDQRGCGRSTPHASADDVDLSTNTTHHLVSDIERLRDHLGVDRWLVFGLSWGSTLALAYAQRHPDRVSGLVLGMVVTTTRREVEWLTRDMGRLFPRQWRRFRDAVPGPAADTSLVKAYGDLLHHPDPAVREQAARQWCAWEDTHLSLRPGHTPDPRFNDPEFRLSFARLVTHYWRHAAFLRDGELLEGMDKLRGIPGILVHGTLDVSSPMDVPWQLHQRWPDSRLVTVEGAGHRTSQAMDHSLRAATDSFIDA
jgi:proline iminopeptidase